MIRVRAPGKAILAGEYAVLHGAPAIAVAVDRDVIAGDGTPADGAGSPFVAAARAHAAAACGWTLGPVQVDSSALYEAGDKLGLGSSAAVTAAVVGLAFARAGRALDADRRALFDVADAAHAAAQGTRGSGVDVACSVFGGALRFCRQDGAVAVTPVALPVELRMTFLWAGRPASTAELIGRVKALAEADPPRHRDAIAQLTTHAQGFAGAVAAADAAALIAAASAYGDGMAALGDACGCAIVTPAHAAFAAIARRHGGAAKPSGAGGGDLGVAFTVGDNATRALRDEARAAGLTLLSLGAPAPGLRLENA
jgi:phosphomevalonate kinase